MPGQLQLKRTDKTINILDDVENIGVATPFLIINYVDGTTVLVQGSEYTSVQFTPYPPDEQSPEGESTDNQGA